MTARRARGTSKSAKPDASSPAGDTFNLSGDFRNATVNIQSTIVGAAEVRDIETLKPEPGDPPYKGLQYFTEKDADAFFGREQLTARLVNRLSGVNFLTVIGASGSGKSSLVRAGVIPALTRGLRLVDGSIPPANSTLWTVRVLTPTAHPLQSLAAALSTDIDSIAGLAQSLQSDPKALCFAARKVTVAENSPRLLLVIDQFEEVFTQCRDEAERKGFIDGLLAAVDPEDPQPVTLLVLLRADFYANLAQYDHLRERVAGSQEFIGAMSRDELFNAIVKPAALGNWKIQEGLVELMLDDIGTEPGALPLLSHALLETWNHRRGRTMTLSAYRESGGVRGAIAQTAEAVFRQRLTPQQQAIARIIFTHLVGLEDDARDTRRRAAFSELVTRSTDAITIDTVLSILTEARLITTGTLEPGNVKVIEVAHEALIREWPTLRQWLDENRAGLILHGELTEATNDWLRLERDPGALYRGTRLKQAVEWAAQNTSLVSLDEQAFLDASQQAAQAEAERERQLQRTRLLRQWVYPALGVVMVGILAVLFFATGLNIRFKTPARMGGVFNIAVAEFGTVSADGKVTAENAGQVTSGWVANKLKSELSGDPNLLVWKDDEDLRQQNVTIGRVGGSTQEQRIAAARAMADRLNAQMVIFGNIDTRQSPAQLVLEFWMAPQAGYDFADLRGPYQVSSPVLLVDPAHPGIEAQPEINRQSSTLAWLALGLTRMRFGQTGEALQSFRKAERFSPDSEAVQFFIGRESLFLAGRDSANRDSLTGAAQKAFARAVDINQNYARAYIGLGSVYYYQAENQVSALPDGIEATRAVDQLAPARKYLQQARASFSHVLELPANAKPPGIPVDLVAKQGIGISLQLLGQIQQISGQTDSAQNSLDESARELEPLIQPLKEAGQERYLAQVYQNLGSTYQLMGFLAEAERNPSESRDQYTRAAQFYDQCINLGKSSPDQIVRDDIAARLCIPYRKDVQSRLDSLSGGS